jgi:sugar O-acyltransferase (sialic acid O-acetyltransferase NeuD family)
MKLYGIVGAGGFGREVIPLVNSQLTKLHPNKNYQLVFVTEETSYSTHINDYLVMNMDEFIHLPADQKYFNIAIAHFETRKRIAHLMIGSNIVPFSIYGLSHTNLGHNEIDIGAIFCDFTFVSPNTKIGRFFHANIYSYIAHDCIIGDFVTFAPKVCCNGGVVVQDDVYIGTGAIIKQAAPGKPIIIGKGAVIGMGAVVTKSVSPYTTVVGNPCSPLIKKETAR